MKPLLSTILVTFLVFLPSQSFALMYELDRPGIAFPKELIQSRENIQKALERDDCKFLGGTAFNSNSALRYSGTTRALSMFLDQLSHCEGVTIRVSFVKSLADGEDWEVLHNVLGGIDLGFHVRVSMGSANIDVTELVIPKISGKNKAEQDGADQPATAPESKTEGEKKPQPESDGRPQ